MGASLHISRKKDLKKNYNEQAVHAMLEVHNI